LVDLWLRGGCQNLKGIQPIKKNFIFSLVIWLTGRAIRKRDPNLYPVGRTRLEPIALVSFYFLILNYPPIFCPFIFLFLPVSNQSKIINF